MNKTKHIILTPAVYEQLVAQIESLPYALAKPLLQLLRSNAQSVEVTPTQTDSQTDKA